MIIFKMTYKEREVILIDLQVEKMRLLYQSYERKRETFIIKDLSLTFMQRLSSE